MDVDVTCGESHFVSNVFFFSDGLRWKTTNQYFLNFNTFFHQPLVCFYPFKIMVFGSLLAYTSLQRTRDNCWVSPPNPPGVWPVPNPLRGERSGPPEAAAPPVDSGSTQPASPSAWPPTASRPIPAPLYISNMSPWRKTSTRTWRFGWFFNRILP